MTLDRKPADESAAGSARFKQLLDEQNEWPTAFTFKFIVPIDRLPALEEILSGFLLQTRPSRKGNYIAVTCAPLMASSDEVMSIYERTSHIEGIVSL